MSFKTSATRLHRSFAARLALIVLLVPSVPLPGSAQTVEEQVRQMATELKQLRQELDVVKEELRRVKFQAYPVSLASTALPEALPPLPETPLPAAAAPALAQGPPQELTPGEILPLIQAQVQEQAQTKIETNTKFPMRVFGTIASNTFLNTGEPNWLDLGNVIAPVPAGLPSGSFSSSLRQSRIGAILDGPSIGKMKTSGFLAMDFFGGIPNFQMGQVFGIPRLLYAFVRIEGARTAFQIGQDHVILAPKNPTSLTGMAFPILFRAGNLYLRAPQIRAEQVLASGNLGELRIVGGIVAPVAGDFSTVAYQFVPPNLAGERSRRPAVESRISWGQKPAGPYEEPKWEFGVSGHYSKERYLTGLRPSKAIAVDFDATVSRFGIGGEFFAGENIDQFGASLAQIARSRGGFGEIRFAAARNLDFNGGYGTDRLYDRFRFTGLTLRRSASFFANTIYHFTPEIATSLEWRKLQTTPIIGRVRTNNHFDLTFAYSF